MTTRRTVLRDSRSGRNQVRELLQSVFLAELIAPSRELWIVSPWISDIEVIDDSVGAFASFVGDHGGSLSISLAFAKLAARQTRVRIVTRPNQNKEFLAALKLHLAYQPYEKLVQIQEVDELHTKGILGDDYQITGSMNFTFNGVRKNDELIHLDTDPDLNAQLRLEFEQAYGN